jgi:hypothetical protein
MTELLFHDDARTLGGTRFLESLGDRKKEAGRDGQVMRRVARVGQYLTKLPLEVRIVVIAAHVAKLLAELRVSGSVDSAAILGQTLAVVGPDFAGILPTANGEPARPAQLFPQTAIELT